MNSGRNLLLVVATLVSGALGCKSKDRTEIVVEVDSNLGVPADTDKVLVQVDLKGGKIQRLPFSLKDGRYTLPIRVGLLPHESHVSDEITVTASALKGDNEELVVREEAVVSFLKGQSLLLRLYLARECRGDPCKAEGKACTRDGRCVDIRRPTLPPYQPDEVASRDAGGADAPQSVDAPGAADRPIARDSASAEVARDASVADSPATDAAEVARDAAVADSPATDARVPMDMGSRDTGASTYQCRLPSGVTCCLCAHPTGGDTCCVNLDCGGAPCQGECGGTPCRASQATPDAGEPPRDPACVGKAEGAECGPSTCAGQSPFVPGAGNVFLIQHRRCRVGACTAIVEQCSQMCVGATPWGMSCIDWDGGRVRCDYDPRSGAPPSCAFGCELREVTACHPQLPTCTIAACRSGA